MNDKELADRIVALGVGEFLAESYWAEFGYTQVCYDAAGFVRDWQVAGAMMERCLCIEIDKIGSPWWTAVNCTAGPQPHKYFKSEGESLPRAINEACCEALS